MCPLIGRQADRQTDRQKGISYFNLQGLDERGRVGLVEVGLCRSSITHIIERDAYYFHANPF